MHLTSQLIHPATAQVLNAVSGLTVAYCGWRALRAPSEKSCTKSDGAPPIPFAFAAVFALQMLNVATPWGFSMHLMGAAVLTLWYGVGRSIALMAGILAIQAIVLGDGDMGAWGTNVLSMGILPSLGMAACLRWASSAKPYTQAGVVFAGTVLTLVLTLGTLAATLTVPTAYGALTGAHLVLALAEAAITTLAFAVTTMPASEQHPVQSTRRIATAMLSLALMLALTFISSAPDTLHWALHSAQ